MHAATSWRSYDGVGTKMDKRDVPAWQLHFSHLAAQIELRRRDYFLGVEYHALVGTE